MKIKTILTAGMLLCTLFFESNVFSGTSDGGYVSHVASYNGNVLFAISGGTERDRPACATTKRFAIKNKSEHHAIIMTAFAQKQSVVLGNVLGAGTCNLHVNAEDLIWIELNNK